MTTRAALQLSRRRSRPEIRTPRIRQRQNGSGAGHGRTLRMLPSQVPMSEKGKNSHQTYQGQHEVDDLARDAARL